MRLDSLRSALAPTALVLVACGPGVGDGDGPGSGGQGSGPLDSTTQSPGASDTGGRPGTTAPADGTTATPGDTTTALTSTSDGSGTDDPPGLRCGDRPPVADPPTPDGCEPVWLVDAAGEPIVGAHSGYVRCDAPDGANYVVYQTAKVACPELIGDECLCDADCPGGQQCVCANVATTGAGLTLGNRCFPSDCESADDCVEGDCRFDIGECVGAWLPEALRCTTPADDCVYDSECTNFCDWDELEELFTCQVGAICE